MLLFFVPLAVLSKWFDAWQAPLASTGTILSQARNSGTPSISRGANHWVTEMKNLLNAPFVFQWLWSRSMIYWLQVLEGVIVSWSFYKFLIYQFSIEMFEKHWVSLHLLNSFDSVYCMIGNDWLDTHIQRKKYPLRHQVTCLIT